MAHWTDAFSFTTGVVRYKDLFYLIATEDKLARKQTPHASILTWDQGQWGQGDVEWTAVSVCAVKYPQEQMVAVGETGEAQVCGSGEEHDEEIRDGVVKPDDRGDLRFVRSIGGHAYATGMDRQVYRRQGRDEWVCIDESMRPAKDDESLVGFNGIDGVSEKEIFAVGFQGAIWHYNGRTWKELQSPTNIVLSSVCCAGDGNVYACGRRGTLLRGDRRRWEVIDHGKSNEDFWGLAWYQNKLYVSSLRRVLTLEKGDRLRMVDMDEPVTSAYHLSAQDGVLLSIGPKDVMLNDGAKWIRIE